MPEVTALLALPPWFGLIPAEALVSTPARFRFGPSSAGVAVAVALADGVAAGGQGRGFLVVHRHAGEGLANVRPVFSGSGLPFTPSGLT
jgi:hypothetical protein